MATLNNGTSGTRNSGHQHDGQKDYQHSNQSNPDNIRDNTRDHRYKEHNALTDDANFDVGKPALDFQMDDKDQNVDPNEAE